MGEAVIGMAAMTAGDIGGTLAGQALFGAPPVPGPDTSVPGVTSATMEQGGKGKPDKKIAQVDISQSLAWFQQAAQDQNTKYMQGLNYFQSAMAGAAQIVKQNYALANATLQPMADGSVEAFNEQMRFLGLDPISKSASFSNRANLAGLPPSIVKELADAEIVKDTGVRRQIKQSIINKIGEYATSKDAEIAKLQAQQAALQNAPTNFGTKFDKHSQQLGGQISLEQAIAANKAGFNLPTSVGGDIAGLAPSDGYVSLTGAQVVEFNKYLDAMAAEVTNRPQKLAELQQQINGVKSLQNDLNTFGSEYGTAYQDTYDSGYTNEQITQKLQATPGYQFTMDQGTQAIERQGAAKGMLGSGNTLQALTKFGQDTGMQYFNQHMAQLSNIVQQGSGAVTQTANNQTAEAGLLAGLLQTTGTVTNEAYQQMGNNLANSLYQQGNLFNNAAQFNVTAQNNYLQQDKKDKEQAALQAAMAAAMAGGKGGGV